MPYFDEIEDDILSMRRDINGFKPRLQQIFEENEEQSQVDLGEKTTWDEI